MQLKHVARAVPMALAVSVPSLLVAGAGTSGAATVRPAAPAHASPQMTSMTVTKSGTFEKLLSSTSFKMDVGMKPYTVKVNDMTHITVDMKKVKLATLKKGDTVTVKGVLEMGTIIATSVTAGM